MQPGLGTTRAMSAHQLQEPSKYLLGMHSVLLVMRLVSTLSSKHLFPICMLSERCSLLACPTSVLASR